MTRQESTPSANQQRQGVPRGTRRIGAAVAGIRDELKRAYASTTCRKLKALDAYIVLCCLLSTFQFIYRRLVPSGPFNIFIAGFMGSTGAAVLAACLRAQLTPPMEAGQPVRSEDNAGQSPPSPSETAVPRRLLLEFAAAYVLLFAAVAANLVDA